MSHVLNLSRDSNSSNSASDYMKEIEKTVLSIEAKNRRFKLNIYKKLETQMRRIQHLLVVISKWLILSLVELFTIWMQ